MSSQPQQEDPTGKKGMGFALMPFAPWLIIVAIALSQSGAFKKASNLQNANAGNDIRQELKQCYASLGLAARGIDTAPIKDVNDRLFDCKEELKRKS